MAQKEHSRELLQETINAVATHGGRSQAACALGINKHTLENRYAEAKRRGVKPTVEAKGEIELKLAKAEVKRLEAELRNAQREKLDAAAIKREIIKLAQAPVAPPRWTLAPKKDSKDSPGVPTLFLSDLHWGEYVDANQVGGVNSYSLAIARKRLKTTTERAIYLAGIVSPQMRYPGIVVPLGGDMVSGDIHEELMATNEIEIMPTVLDLRDNLITAIDTLAKAFGHVFLPCVTGNHGRNTKKIRAKGRAFTSFDWLLYQILAKQFEKDKRVQFYIPDGSDAHYRIFGHRYLLNHGDQFTGGDGIIGAIGPIARGDHKKRSRDSQVGQDYDTMLVGHWHQHMQLRRFIVNGSLKGYDEYAYVNNFPFEPPAQAFWITHPQVGKTFSMPIYAERPQRAAVESWAAWQTPVAA